MASITAVVHTKNSAKTLGTCLDSLQWCDAIFVIDMESDDETIAIAKKHNATIFREKALQFADPIRNTYLHKVKTEWTLIVDSDEEIPKTLAEKLSDLSKTQGINGYRVPRANIIFDKWIEHTGFWPDYIVRFFRTGTCTYPPYVHGQPVIEGVTETIPPQKEFAIVHHHYTSVTQYLMRLNVYTSLEVEKMQAADIRLQATDFLKSFFDEFFRRFFKEKGYLDGGHGFVISLLQAIYMLVVQMKLWEKNKKALAITLDEIETSVNSSCSDTMYWVSNEKMITAKPIEKIKLQIKRKLVS